MSGTVGKEHQIRIGGRPERLSARVSLAAGMFLAHLLRAVGGMATMCSRSVTEITGASHGVSILSLGKTPTPRVSAVTSGTRLTAGSSLSPLKHRRVSQNR